MAEPARPYTTRVPAMDKTIQSRTIQWVLLTGDRDTIAIGITGVFGAFFLGLTVSGIAPLEFTQSLFYAYSGLIAGNLTLITVIVSINQLFLSRELRTPGELRTQIKNIIEYRRDIEHATGQVAPSTPLNFLLILAEATRQKAQEVGGYARNGVITAGGEELDEVVTTLTAQMDRIDDHLREPTPDTFKVLSVMLGTNYAQHIYRLRVVRSTHEAEIGDIAHEAIEELIDRLHDIDVSRQYFRSIYLQEELSALSRILLYTGLPSVAVLLGTLVVLTVRPADPSHSIDLELLLPITITIGLVPLAVLCSFFLRTATVTKLTAATVPFTTPEDARL